MTILSFPHSKRVVSVSCLLTWLYDIFFLRGIIYCAIVVKNIKIPCKKKALFSTYLFIPSEYFVSLMSKARGYAEHSQKWIITIINCPPQHFSILKSVTPGHRRQSPLPCKRKRGLSAEIASFVLISHHRSEGLRLQRKIWRWKDSTLCETIASQ